VLAYILGGIGIGITGGHHVLFLSVDTLQKALKIGFITFLFSLWANLFIKISVALMLLRIKSQSFWWRIFLYALIIVSTIIASAFTIVWFLSCRPLEATWTLQLRLTNACWSPHTLVSLLYFFGAYFALTDLICALLP
jgi:hypothetical protein